MFNMRQELLLLKWKFYTENFPSALSEEAADNQFADVILVSDEFTPFRVHIFCSQF